MKCTNCGQELGENVKICPICKSEQSNVEVGSHFDTVVDDQTEVNFMESTSAEEMSDRVTYEKPSYPQRSRVVAGLLQLFFGGFGIGRFYLGYNGIAMGQLFTFPIFFIGGIWGFIDGILILCGQVEQDANGILLK